MKLGEQKNRDEEPVQVHTPCVIECHLNHICNYRLHNSYSLLEALLLIIMVTIVVGAFIVISKP